MYYEYWGLTKAPFDNVPDPSMYVESHSSVETAVAETLFAIEEGNECMAVIVGDVGSGKTLSLRLILDALDQDKYRIVLVTNPDMSFVDLLKEIIGQLTDKECETKRKIELLEAFNRLLFETVDKGKKVVILIDEANAMSGPNLESLRLLTNMQDDSHNLFTLVLAGQMELAKRLEHPRRANLYQRIGTYNRIERIESISALKDYVETRLRLAGAQKAFFTEDALASLWKHSEHGVPRLVNKICKLCLKAGETNGFHLIDERIVDPIGSRFTRLRSRSDRKEDRHTEREPQKTFERSPGVRIDFPSLEAVPKTQKDETPVRATRAVETMAPSPPERKEQQDQRETAWETDIGSFHIRIAIPSDVMRQAVSSTSEIRTKLAGSLAAQTLQKYPQLAFSASHDPVALWSDIRKSIINAMEQHTPVLRAG
jgi:type II secretory pathway predicted ATPase ExeA